MAPKKLTDCPENLRESIDWLIQVRYGNGGKGLDELAKALKKLIEEAIEQANASLDDRKKQLQCPDDYYSDKRNDSYCKKTTDKITELKNDDDPKNEKELKKLQSEYDEHINKDHSLDKSIRESKIKEQDDNFEKLKKSLEAFIGKKGINNASEIPAKNVLENLCDGVETFLGFNSSSKGYTGQGIVYSDLDRLCDAVMGFLSGVLGAVKDDEAVKTYDKDISGDKIDTVISKLQSSVGTGRNGLVASVGAVREWLEGYEGKVGEKTKNVENDLTALKDATISNKISEIHNSQSGGLKAMNDEFQKSVNEIDKKMSGIKNNKQGHFALDKQLKNKLALPFSKIDGAIELLKKSAGNGVIEMQAKMVDETLLQQEKEMIKTIEDESKRVQYTLEKGLWDVRNTIASLRDTKRRYIEGLKKSVEETQRFMNREFEGYDGSFRLAIDNYFNEIKAEVYRSHALLNEKQKKLNRLVSDAKTQFRIIHRGFMGDSAEQHTNINKIWMAIRAQMNELVKDLANTDRSAGDEIGTLQQIAEGVRDYAAKFADGRFANEILDGWINEILVKNKILNNKLEIYVNASYKNQARGQFTREEVSRILNGTDPLLHKHIKSQIIDQLKKAVIHKSTKSLKFVSPGDNIANQLTNVREVCNTFAETLEQEIEKAEDIVDAFLNIRSTGIVAYASKVTKAVDEQLRREVNFIPPGGNEKYNLQEAVKIILRALSTMARQLATDLVSFTGGNGSGIDIKKVDEAIQKVKPIFSQFDGNQLIDMALTGVTAAVTKLEPTFGQTKGHLETVISDIQNVVVTELERLKKDKDDEEDQDDNDGVINQQRKAANDKMDALKYKIRDKLIDIIEVISQTDETLSTDVSDLNNTLDAAYRNSTQMVEKCKANLTRRVHDAFNEITKQVRLLFATQKIADLNSLKELIDEQQIAVRKQIDEDKISGVKGLLNKMETWLPQHGTPILFKAPLSFESVTTEFTYILHSLLEYTEQQIMTPGMPDVGGPASMDHENELSKNIRKIHGHVSKLLAHLKDNANRLYNFDDVFPMLRDALHASITAFTPSSFSGIHNPALADALRAGLTLFCAQLNHAYVNSYSGLTVEWSKRINGKPQLTDDADRCAKLFLTCLSTLFEYLSKLMNECQYAWMTQHISSTMDLGKWFGECGFRVSTSDANRDGELRNTSKFQGRNILPLITNDNHVFNRFYVGNLKDIFGYLQDYLRVCHLTPRPKPRSPCSVYDMLCWLTGLTYRSYYRDVSLNSFNDLLDKPEKSNDAFELDGIGLEIQTAKTLEAYPETITAAKLTDAITEVCHYADDILKTVLGHGDANGTYAVEHSNNSLNLYYPPRSEDCLQMVIDVIRSMQQPLTFLKKQCELDTKYYGWEQCTYGSGVQPSCWQCGEHSSIYPSSSHDCSGTSPLQLYLTDSLGGMLPHSLASIGCKSSCSTCTKWSPGMPCLTPLGFSRFSRGTRTGKDLSNVLTKFLSNDHLACLITLVPKPPSTLPEHYDFVMSLVRSSVVPLTLRQATNKSVADAFKKCISEQTIDLYKNPTDLTNALGDVYGSSQSSHEAKSNTTSHEDLFSLSMKTPCSDQDVHCAPYIECLSANCYKFMAKQHANLYLSWSIYLPWNLWNYLCSLLDAFGSINCKSFGCPGCSCKPSSHGAKHNCRCRALVCCRAVLPTFYRYGFTFKDPQKLLDGKNRKRCSHFYTQLESVVKSTYFTKLFNQCDMILWRIREPFSYFVLALWLLSLFYLICVMVGRLDVLHIKSHLRIPSSHRITAQSLLAAAQVGRLAKISYLQP